MPRNPKPKPARRKRAVPDTPAAAPKRVVRKRSAAAVPVAEPSARRSAAADVALDPAKRRRGDDVKAGKGEIVKIKRGDDAFEFRDRLPLLPLRDVVVYPYMTIPLLVGRLPSINAIEKAVTSNANDLWHDASAPLRQRQSLP